MGPRFATLDVGTNTVLLLVAERLENGDFVPVLERAEITRLGEGVDRTRRLSPEALDRTCAVLKRFAEEARASGAREIACVATSAARDATNGAEFIERAAREAGIRIEIIEGALEAELTYETAARELGTSHPLLVIDIGGGSTEFVLGQGGTVTFRTSLDLGAVRLTERHVRSDPPMPDERAAMVEAIDTALGAIPRPTSPFQLVGIAGTVTTLAAVALGVEPWDPEKIHRSRLTRETIDRQLSRLFTLPLEERRRLPGMEPKRADVICAGALLLSRALHHLEAEELVVSDRGVRWGLLYHRFGARSA